jgi:hypothetical protein
MSMPTVRLPVIAIAVTIAALAWSFRAQAVPADTPTIDFPTDYRTWAHVKSVLVGPQSKAFQTEGGIHHIYANAKAMEGYKTSKFPDGSVIVYDLLEVTETNGNTVESTQRRVDVMVKDGTRFAATGGWGFARYFGAARADGTLPPDRMAACYECHSKRKDRDGVFSEFRK